MNFRRFFLLILVVNSTSLTFGQACTERLHGHVVDATTKTGVPYATIYMEESGQGTTTDESGYFELHHHCEGLHHIRIESLNYTALSTEILVQKDSLYHFYLNGDPTVLKEVIVMSDRSERSTQEEQSIGEMTILKEGNKNLSDVLASISGVSTLKNGAGISKPIVHGLYGNRVAILNNGIAQTGQQWGNDHAPEIDPTAANRLSVIKGAASVAYQTDALGSVVLVESGAITEHEHLMGNVNYIFETNGLGHTLSTTLEKKDSWASWRVNASLKANGDRHAPNYFLTNTGKREGHFSADVRKKIGKGQHQLYYSFFNAEIGVLRGAHVGNQTDLALALDREIPLFTSDEFSYDINAPRQLVQHHLLKWESTFFLENKRVIQLKYGGQLNNRQEFDVRRGGRTDQAAMKLNQFSHFLETNFQQAFDKQTLLKTGLQFQTVDNANLPGTGVLPLIPRYESYNYGGFAILQKEIQKWQLEWGGRYDFRVRNIANITNTLPREIELIDQSFHNYTLSSGAKYQWSPSLSVGLDVGYMLRAPAINELFSFGLHQGVSGIEQGDQNLSEEKSFKSVFAIDYRHKNRFTLHALAYYHAIDDYIYLQPQSEFRQTIRGSFPVFDYQQTDARLIGMDWQVDINIRENLTFTGTYAVVRGRDLTNKSPLIFVPADNLQASLQYQFNNTNRFSNTFLSVSTQHVWEQTRFDITQDYAAAPAGYTLFGLALETTIRFGEDEINIGVGVDNLFNTTYRDYLNRLRYFADEMGRNIQVRCNYVF